MQPVPGGKSPYKYRSLEAFLKAHPEAKKGDKMAQEDAWYDWEVGKFSPKREAETNIIQEENPFQWKPGDITIEPMKKSKSASKTTNNPKKTRVKKNNIKK